MSDRLSTRWMHWIYLVIMALVTWQLLFRTQVQTDLSAFLPGAQDEAQQMLLQQLEQGPAARLWMLALSGAEPEVLADISRKLSRKAAASPLVNQVLNGTMELDQAVRDQLFEYRYLVSNRIAAESFSREGLDSIFEELLQILRSPLSTFSKEMSRRDPGGEFPYLLKLLGAPTGGPAVRQGVWFNEQGDQALLLLQSVAAGTDLDAQLELRRKVSTWLDEITGDGGGGRSVVLAMGGVPLISLQSRDRIRHASLRLSAIATVFMLLFMFLVYRQPRRVFLTALPLVSGVLTGAACVSWWFGSIHGITLAFGATLLGVAVDYPVHLFSHQRSGEPLERVARRIWPTLALSVLSTVLGFSAMLWSDFPGLTQLGVFSVSGLLTAALVSRYLLPLLAGPPPTSTQRFSLPGNGPAPILGTGYKLLLGLLLLLATMWVIQGKEIWSRDIQALSPVPADIRLADQQMRQSMGAAEPGHAMLLTADTVQQLLEKQEQLAPLLDQAETSGYIRGADYAAKILPSVQRQLQRRQWIPDEEELIARLDAALNRLPFRAAGFTPFVEALQHSRQLPPMTPDMLAGSALGIRFDSLLQHSDERVNGLVQLVGVSDPLELAELLDVSSREDLWLLDIPRATGELVDGFREEVTVKAVLAVILIAVLAGLWLRDPARWLRVMAPVLLSVTVSVSLVLSTGVSLNLFHLVSLLLVAGIGLDYALFFSRPGAGSVDRQGTVHAVTVCCISTVVVFSLLAASDIPVLHAIGLTVASGALAAFGLSWLISREPGAQNRNQGSISTG